MNITDIQAEIAMLEDQARTTEEVENNAYHTYDAIRFGVKDGDEQAAKHRLEVAQVAHSAITTQLQNARRRLDDIRSASGVAMRNRLRGR